MVRRTMRALLRFLGMVEAETRDIALAPSTSGTTLGAGVAIKGELHGEGSLIILGRFEGEIVQRGPVHIGPQAWVDANINAAEIIIAGVVRGNLSADARVEILATGSLTGTLKSGGFSAADGAKAKGEISVEPQAAAQKP